MANAKVCADTFNIVVDSGDFGNDSAVPIWQSGAYTAGNVEMHAVLGVGREARGVQRHRYDQLFGGGGGARIQPVAAYRVLQAHLHDIHLLA